MRMSGLRASGFQLHQHLREIAVAGRSADQGDVRGAIENLFAFLLRYATEDSELLALLEEFLVIVEAVENLLLRFIADGAGVVENQVGLLDRVYLLIAFVDQRADDFFRVMDVHLAAEGFQVEGFVRGGGHIEIQYKGWVCGSDRSNCNSNGKGNSKGNGRSNGKVKGLGQECPSHTCNGKINSKGFVTSLLFARWG